jgi:hypothetical protein
MAIEIQRVILRMLLDPRFIIRKKVCPCVITMWREVVRFFPIERIVQNASRIGMKVSLT